MKRRAGAGGVADIVNKQSHGREARLYLIRQAVTVHWEHVSARSHPRIRHPLLRGGGRLPARVRVPRERAQFLLSQLQRAGCAAADRRPGSAARGAAPADRAGRGRDRIGEPVSDSNRICWCSSSTTPRPATSRWCCCRISGAEQPRSKALKGLVDENVSPGMSARWWMRSSARRATKRPRAGIRSSSSSTEAQSPAAVLRSACSASGAACFGGRRLHR